MIAARYPHLIRKENILLRMTECVPFLFFNPFNARAEKKGQTVNECYQYNYNDRISIDAWNYEIQHMSCRSYPPSLLCNSNN